MTQSTSKKGKPGDLRTISLPNEVKAFILPEGMEFDGKITVKPIETPANRQHRHRMEVREFHFKLAIHIAIFLFLIIVAVVALIIAFQEGHSIESQKWAVSILTSMVIAMTGYVVGRAAK